MPTIRSNYISNYEERTNTFLREQLFIFNSDLRQLKYDPNSNQPYIQKDIPEPGEDPQNDFGPDLLLRGGLLQPIRAAEDVSRLGKFFTDTKNVNGLLFASKQNLLSQIGVQTQAQDGVTALNEGAYLPTSTLLQAGAGTLNGIHLNKQGLNPFGGDSLFGITLPGGLPEYTTEVAKEDERLVRLTTEKIGFLGSEIEQPTNPNSILYDYRGGPKSAGGFGRTTLNRFSDTVTLRRGSLSSFINTLPDPIADQSLNVGIQEYGILTETPTPTQYTTNSEVAKLDSFEIGRGRRQIFDFRRNLNNNPETEGKTSPNLAPDYNLRNLERRVNIGDPGNGTLEDRRNYDEGRDNSGADKINMSPIYTSRPSEQSVNDFVKFRIYTVDSENPSAQKYMHFRAFLESFSDDYSGEWEAQKYMGRAENFYRYQGFDRTIQIGWKMAAQSRQELIPMYQKLNYLASNTAPDYVRDQYMAGPIVRVTVGGYLYQQYGFISSLSLNIPQESPWEISIPVEQGQEEAPSAFGRGDVKEVPHYMDVNMSFTPIHDFAPRKNTGVRGNSSRQRFIALSNGRSTNYV